MANKYLSYREQVKKIKNKGASCECIDNLTLCESEKVLEKILSTNNYTRVFTPFKHAFLDFNQQIVDQQIKIFNEEILNSKSDFHKKYRNIFKEKDNHKYRINDKFFSIDFINKVYDYDKKIQLKMWDKINNFEIILKTNMSYFITNEIQVHNELQEEWLPFLIKYKYLEQKEVSKYIKYIKNREQNFWFSINFVTLNKNLKVLQNIVKNFQLTKNRKKGTKTYDSLLKLFEYFKEIKLFKVIYNLIEQEKKINNKQLDKLKKFIWFLNQIRNSLAHTKTMQQCFYEMRIGWLKNKFFNEYKKQNVKLEIEKHNEVKSIIENNGEKVMLYSFSNKIIVRNNYTIVFEDSLKDFTNEILKFGKKFKNSKSN